MGLFSKKNCCICDAKIGLLGGLKLKDGYLCKDCKKKLSPFLMTEKNQLLKISKNNYNIEKRIIKNLMI